MPVEKKKTKDKTMRELCDTSQAVATRMNEILDLAEKEERELTDAERKELRELQDYDDRLHARARAAANETREHYGSSLNSHLDEVVRENFRKGVRTEMVFMRDVMMVSDVNTGGLVPLNVLDILKPLEESTIYNKVGISLPTGLSGTYEWPTYETVTATIAGEGVALSDTTFGFSKLTASPERVGIKIPATSQSLLQSQGILERIIRTELPNAVARLINKIAFSRSKVNSSTNLQGPFVGKTVGTISEVPTARELNLMKAGILASGIDGEHMAYVMSKTMEAILEVEPINKEGVYIPMIQNHMLLGLPVFTTNLMQDSDGTQYVGIGDWRYQMIGLFHQIRFILDPYTLADKDEVRFVLNCDYATKCLRPEAFAISKATKATVATQPSQGGGGAG